jgi:hypothetical protein
LSVEEVEDIKEMFRKIDTDNDGIVSIEELKAGLQKFNSQLAVSEVQMLIEAVSVLACLPCGIKMDTQMFTHMYLFIPSLCFLLSAGQGLLVLIMI